MPTVNKRELAALLSTSLPTLDELIRRYPDFPVISRGSNGVSWEFDPDVVVAFLNRAREREAEEEASRADLLAQYRIPGLDTPADSAPGAKPADVLNTIRAQRQRHEMAKEAGQLLWKSDVRMQLAGALAGMNRFIHDMPGQVGRRFNLPDEVVAHMKRLIADQQAEFTRTLGELLPPEGPHGP